VTFNNDLDHDIVTLERFHDFRREAERKGFRYFLEVFDPNIAGAVKPEVLPYYINDMVTRMLAGVSPAGRPVFLKMVYHGPRAMEELVRSDPHLVVGILGGSAGTTRDAFQLLHDAQKYGAKVALFGRKINNAENQLAFVHFLRLIVEGQVGPVDAVRAYHAVLARLGLRPHRPLDDDLVLTDQSMSYAGTGSSATVPARPGDSNGSTVASTLPALPVSANGSAACACHSTAEKEKAPREVPRQAEQNGKAGGCGCHKSLVTESSSSISRYHHGRVSTNGHTSSNQGRPDFSRMSPAERLSYHRERLGLGR
jgi:hypothetical protein